MEDSENKAFTHKHIIFYIDDIMKKLISSENILMDCTFSYSKNFYETFKIICITK